jgi:periplasmic divalent cation tolerance protein
MAEEVIVVMVTCPPEDAERIAKHVVENRHAACANIVTQLRSIYRWEGRVCDDQECLMYMKTTREHFEALSTAVREVHPYSVPEIIALPIVDGYDGYMRWVRENTGPEQPAD